ncbi:MAG TPA: acyltransferase [Candidatus Cybelea sp.]|nr:acyltransferase [Candidatus Cybelea sp.]
MKRFAVDRLGYPPGSGVPIWLVNWLFQRVFRLDAECRYNKHFTSRLLHTRGLEIEDECPIVRRSLTVSGGCYINAADGLWIGRGTIWAPNVAIVSQEHGRDDLRNAPPTPGIRIGRDCWLGFGSIVMPGVILGERTIVGANAVVTKSFPEGNVVLAGAPAQVVGVRSAA